MTESSRHVLFEACFNFRDLGGYETDDGHRVRWNLLYRSDTLHRLTAADAETFSALGLRTVIDLRSRTEIEDFGRLGVATETLVWHSVPMLDDVKLIPREASESPPPPPQALSMGEGYLRIVEEYGDSVAEVFELLTRDHALPAVFHCTSGKDRTGIVAALLLDLVGVPDATIAADYVLTEQARARSTPWIEANEPGFAALLAQIPPERRVLSSEAILGFLAGIRSKHGTVRDFLMGLGVTEEQLDLVRARLLDG